ncbi:hypothetical protein MAM1_0088c04812 [Mucor ambiguus]|uniref:Uncharacterized protein n=1 Tax=Mucor ambiguus TaxID=91626 RepID=A0A0C9MPZ4_9FUNG|nr:hypothetical protein MAM1_0088c04812 [Mucor ambiguus]
MEPHNDRNEEHSKVDRNDSVMAVVGSSIQGIHGAIEAMYSQFEKTTQRTLEMTTGMPHLIERMLRANVEIGSLLAKHYTLSTFKPAGNGNICMSLMIYNTTNLPVTTMTGVLKFENKEFDIVYQRAHYQHDDGETLPNVFESPCNLAPQTCYKQDIEIRINEIEQCNGTITLSIQHPLSSQAAIAIQHTFGLYLIDQLRKEILDNNSSSTSWKTDLELVDTLCYPVAFFRDIFEIQAIKGINSGMCVALSSPKYKIVCEITSVSDDVDFVEVAFSSDHPAFAKQLINELSILGCE